MILALLADRPDFGPLLADWYLQEWPDLYDRHFSPRDELDSCLNRDQLNCTVLGISGGELVAAASLLREDVLPLPECSPWLGSVIVNPAWRGLGHGRQIVQAAVGQARSLGLEQLHLWTVAHRGYYEKMGWQFRRDYHDETRSVSILQQSLIPVHPANPVNPV